MIPVPGQVSRLAFDRALETPFYVFDLSAIEAGAQAMRTAWEEAFAHASVAYSYKTNSLAAITQIMRRAGLAAEVVSGAELELALKDGFLGHDIYFDGPLKRPEELQRAYNLGASIQVDSATEAAEICALSRTCGPVRVNLRLAVRRGRQYSRFGFTPCEAEQARNMLESYGISISGIHFNTGRHSLDTRHFRKALTHWREFIESLLATRPGVVTLDIGSGFPARSSTMGRDLPSPAYYATSIKSLVAEFSWPADRIHVVVEPGRCLVEDHGYLVTSVRTVKHRGRRPLAVVDAGTNLTRSIASWHHDITPEIDGNRMVDIAGAQCYESDYFATKLPCSPHFSVGHRIIVCAAGSYDIPSANVWMRPSPPIYGIEADQSITTICPQGSAIRGVMS